MNAAIAQFITKSSWDRIDILSLIKRQIDRDQRTAFLPRLYNDDGIRQSANQPVPYWKMAGKRWGSRTEFRNDPAAIRQASVQTAVLRWVTDVCSAPKDRKASAAFLYSGFLSHAINSGCHSADHLDFVSGKLSTQVRRHLCAIVAASSCSNDSYR